MTEAEKLFYADIAQKKRVGYGAKHKKNGSKSRQCNLSTDRIMKGAWQKMNGPTFTYQLDKFYTWEEFLGLPVDIQVEYLNRLMEKWQVGQRAIEAILFGKGSGAIANLMKRPQYDSVRNKLTTLQRGANGQSTRGKRIAFQQAIEKWRLEGTPEKEEAPSPTIDLAEGPATGCRMTFSRFDEEAFRMLAKVFAGKSVVVSICVTAED